MEDNIKVGFQQHVGVKWINLARDKDKLQAFMSTVMNIYVSYNAANVVQELSASQEGP
jgi:hypothetical protein